MSWCNRLGIDLLKVVVRELLGNTVFVFEMAADVVWPVLESR